MAITGFREYQKTDVPLSAGEIARVDVKLEVGQLTESVTVQSEAQLLQTDKADVSTQLKSAEIAALPLNQFRNYQALINLVPGATPAAFQNTEAFTPARSLAVSVNGQNTNNNGTRTDGATNMNIWLPHHTMYVSPAETIDTVTVSTNNFDAEQGMAGGAAITVITKSGTNQFKGSAFEFYNSDKLSATAVLLWQRSGGQTGQAAGRAQHFRRHPWRADRAQPLVLLRVVRGIQTDSEPVQLLHGSERRASQRGLQRRHERERLAPGHLRSADGQPGREWTRALREQRDPGQPHPPDRAAAAGPVPAAELRRDGCGQPDQQLSA